MSFRASSVLHKSNSKDWKEEEEKWVKKKIIENVWYIRVSELQRGKRKKIHLTSSIQRFKTVRISWLRFRRNRHWFFFKTSMLFRFHFLSSSCLPSRRQHRITRQIRLPRFISSSYSSSSWSLFIFYFFEFWCLTMQLCDGNRGWWNWIELGGKFRHSCWNCAYALGYTWWACSQE